jgi:very-long-chain (3R)-3-hydroxyacyl-CoA dehydratase
MDARDRTHSASSSWTQPRILYLTAYNVVFTTLWFSAFLNAIFHAGDGKLELFTATEPSARWIQTATLIEVLHSAFGMF